MSTTEAVVQLQNNSYNDIVVLGSGSTVVAQYPPKQTAFQSYSKVYLLTDGEHLMPDLTGLSYRDAAIIMSLYGIDLKKSGIGFVTSQSVKAGTSLNDVTEVTIELK